MLIVEVAGRIFLSRPKCDESRLNVDQPLMTTLIHWSWNELNDADASTVTPENFENSKEAPHSCGTLGVFP